MNKYFVALLSFITVSVLYHGVKIAEHEEAIFDQDMRQLVIESQRCWDLGLRATLDAQGNIECREHKPRSKERIAVEEAVAI